MMSTNTKNSKPENNTNTGEQPDHNPSRQMVQSKLLGQHSHETAIGTSVHIYKRENAYIARGRYDGKAFGEKLGENQQDASQKLMHVLVDIDNGTFRRPSDRPKRQLRRGAPPKVDVRALCDEFLTEKRSTCGQGTCRSYRNRLEPLIEYAEKPEVRNKYSQAADLDREFALGFQGFLHQRQVSRNGRAASEKKRISIRQIYNVLDCCRTLMNWARRPAVNRLSMNYENPFTDDLVGKRPQKDPLQPAAFPLEDRIKLVAEMDAWQLVHLSWQLVLPLRPEDFSGLLICEVDTEKRLLHFGTRFGGADFNKGQQEFVCPYPAEMQWLVSQCIAGRSAGPFLRNRQIVSGRRRPKITVESDADVERAIENAIVKAPGEQLQAKQDHKELVRSTITAMGGCSTDCLGKEFRKVFELADMKNQGRPYDMRGSIDTELEDAGVGQLTHRYVTGHTTRDILNEYVSLKPSQQMQKYFDTLQPLFDAFKARAKQLGLLPTED